MKQVKILVFIILLLSISVFAQRTLPPLEDPAFEAISTAYRVEYHYNKHTYTLYMPDMETPIEFKCKFGFFTSSYETVKIGSIERNVSQRKFDLIHVMDDMTYRVETTVGDVEWKDLLYFPDKNTVAILIKEKDTKKNIGIFYPDKDNPETVFRGMVKGNDYAFLDNTKERFGVLGTLFADERLLKRCRTIEKGGEVIARYIKDRMRGSKINFDLYVKNGLTEQEIADLMTFFISSHQLMLVFQDAGDR